jgi:D-alanyl-D-alanine dipeptidase
MKKLNYLSHPGETSLHNYGCAVDVSIVDEKTGELLDMGSDYDTFEKISEPVHEWHYLKTGELSREAWENRRLLRRVMKLARMNAIPSEWWHFSSMSKEEAVKHFQLIK